MAGIFGLIGAAAGLAGSKPTVPNLPTVSATQAASEATTGNLANLPNVEKLASGVNLFNQNELLTMLNKAIPGYGALQNQEGQTIMSMIRGQVPDANVTATESAAKAVGLGLSGGKGAADLSLRDLGIASLQATEAGLSAADRWIRTTDQTAVPGLFNAQSMFVSPAQQLASDEFNATNQWQVDWLKNRIAAEPGPVAQEAMGIFDWMDQTGKMMAGAYTGNITGAGGQGQPTTTDGSNFTVDDWSQQNAMATESGQTGAGGATGIMGDFGAGFGGGFAAMA